MAMPSELPSLLTGWTGDSRVVHVEHQPARPARYGDPVVAVDPALLERLGVARLWTHQAQAIDLLRNDTSVAIATGTASGKSLCYQIPIAEAGNGGSRPATALAVFPTKALAQDQLRSFADLADRRVVPATYDGDTLPDDRSWVRHHANVVLTNPEMLHYGILPHHHRWATFLKRLRFVVVDELHLLRGVFGSHVAHVLRRLQRLCGHYGSDPTFVFTSATIGEPGRLASELCGRPVTEITDDGSPRGERWFVLWNGDADADGRQESANRTAAALSADLVRAGHRTITFCRSRKATELVAADMRRRLPRELTESVRAYRAGYLATERRSLEEALFAGELRGVVATTALELGVDIGGLDACVLNGFPGTIASLWQQAGRAGRDAQAAVAVLVAGDDQLDQWYMAHPWDLFERPAEPAVINPTNPHVLLPHLACAAHELPLRPEDDRWWGDHLEEGVRRLVLDDLLAVRARDRRHDAPVAVWTGRGWPSGLIGLRGAAGREIRIVSDDGDLIGTVDRARATSVVHPGAVYLHQGEAWRVEDLDLDDCLAVVSPCDGGEYTQPRSTADIAVLTCDTERPVGNARLSLGTVRVTTQVVGYRRFDRFRNTLLGVETLDLPPSELVTRAVWYTMAPELLAAAGLAPAGWPAALHAMEHAAIGLLPLFTICDRWDVGGVSTARQADTGLPTVFIHDGHPGGAGIADLAFAAADRHLQATLDLVAACPCEDGCPSCVQSPKCGNGNEPLSRQGAATLLRHLLGTSVSARRAS
jgi:DEAD/DEAH box helicase domain-containing protein